MPRPHPKVDWRIRFWNFVEPVGEDDCWEWIGSRSPDGYGRLTIAHRPCDAHRLSWELHYGPIPDGLRVLHSCDNPPCVNPKHLFLGTQKDNMVDMCRKGRQRRPHGEEHGNAKLTLVQVRQIRHGLAEGRTQRSLAREFHVSQPAISAIAVERHWAQDS